MIVSSKKYRLGFTPHITCVKKLLHPQRKLCGGFTLLEILVTMGVMSLLSGILVLYNRTGEQQIAIFQEQAKIVNTILRAKSLTLATYAEAGITPCGYGVHFDITKKEYFIFTLPDNYQSACSQAVTANPSYDPNKNTIFGQSNKLSSKLKFVSPAGFTDIVFIKPQPLIVITPPIDPSQTTASIKLSTTATPPTIKTIKVNNFGQITAG